MIYDFPHMLLPASAISTSSRCYRSLTGLASYSLIVSKFFVGFTGGPGRRESLFDRKTLLGRDSQQTIHYEMQWKQLWVMDVRPVDSDSIGAVTPAALTRCMEFWATIQAQLHATMYPISWPCAAAAQCSSLPDSAELHTGFLRRCMPCREVGSLANHSRGARNCDGCLGQFVDRRWYDCSLAYMDLVSTAQSY
jgi:hypothetical protein